MIVRTALAALAALFASPFVFAQSAAKTDPAQAQAMVTQVCAACHAADGNSPSPTNPILAGQHADYTAKQLANFKSGERKSAVMTPIAAPLTPQDMRNLGAYFETQKPKPRAAKDAELVKLGQQIYRGGILAKGVAACSSCHGPSGAGIPAQFPRASGQFAEYTVAQLQAFRSGERANDPNRMMRVIAQKLNDKEMTAVAEYMAGLR
jgi:cytochrome c553